MRTFASVAVLGMMLAGTALAQSSAGDTQRSGEIAPRGSSALERGQSEIQKVMPGASGSERATGGSSMSDQQAATGSSSGSSTTMGTSGTSGSTGVTGSASDNGTAARMGGSSGYGMDQDSQSQNQAQAGDWGKNPNIVRQVQTQLKDDGYDVGAVDGIYGPKTRQALQSFQRDKGQPVTGQIDQNLLAEMDIDTGSQTATVPGSRMQQPSGQSR